MVVDVDGLRLKVPELENFKEKSTIFPIDTFSIPPSNSETKPNFCS